MENQLSIINLQKHVKKFHGGINIPFDWVNQLLTVYRIDV